MKRVIKWIKIAIILIISLIIVSCGEKDKIGPNQGAKAREETKKYLEEKYGEEFVVSSMGRRTDGKEYWYEGIIYPKRYIGTGKIRDSYYRATGYYDHEGAGDNYSKLLLLESMSEHFRPELEKEFGKNVLPIFELIMGGGYTTYESYVESNKEGPTLKGAIYIFGSIKNEKDIKRYQKGIFNFVQFLKSADNNFEYTRLAFIVIDERVLEDDFYDLGIKRQLIMAKEESKTEQEFLAKREKILSQIKITNSDKSERIDSINRGEISKGITNYFGDYALGVLYIVSPKMMESMSYENLHREEVGKIYEKIEEITIRGFLKNLKERDDAKNYR